MGGVPLPNLNLTGGAGGQAGPAVSGPVNFRGGTVNVGVPLASAGSVVNMALWASLAAVGYYLWKKFKK